MVAVVIVPLRRGQPAGEESAGVEFMIRGRALGEHRAHSGVRGVGLHHELEERIWMATGVHVKVLIVEVRSMRGAVCAVT